MKNPLPFTRLFLFVCLIGVTPLFSQSSVWHAPVDKTNINVRGNPVVVAQITVDLSEAGEAIIHFDGNCISDVGDRIILAASNTPDWGANDGAVAVEAISTDFNTFSFSHTRGYSVSAGSNTFYAVVENYVEKDGSGIASVYGSLTVNFTPASSPHISKSVGIQKTNVNLRGAPVAVGHLDLNLPSAGKVIVHFDGFCYSTIGDLIVLAASDELDWTVNDGNVGVETCSADCNQTSFTHTRVYDVTAGNHTFYAVAENVVETGGSGIASIYGNLTVDFIPASSRQKVEFEGISETNVDMQGIPVVLAQKTLDITEPGKVWVQFDGSCYTDEGDRIILAASNTTSWGINDGNVSVEAIDNDVNHHCFSHTRVYDVTPGTHSFYALGNNYVETAGDGHGSVYGALTVRFFPQSVSGLDETAGVELLNVFPNPAGEQILVAVPEISRDARVALADASGKIIATYSGLQPVDGHLMVDVSALGTGVYILNISDQGKVYTAKFVKE